MRPQSVTHLPLTILVVLLFAGLALSLPLLATAQPTAPPPAYAYVWSTAANEGLTLTLSSATSRDISLAAVDAGSIENPAVARTENGLFTIWGLSRCLDDCAVGVTDLRYRLVTEASPPQPIVHLTDHSTATIDTYDREPVAAVAANGTVGVLWHRLQFTDTAHSIPRPANADSYRAMTAGSATADNLYVATLTANGKQHTPPTLLTGYTLSDTSPALSRPRIASLAPPGKAGPSSAGGAGQRGAATDDNRFHAAWKESRYADGGSTVTDTLYYAVLRSDGTAVLSPTRFLTRTGTGSALGGLSLLSLGDRVLVTTIADGDLQAALVDSAGTILSPTAPVVTDAVADGADPDATLLADGTILVAWSAYNAEARQTTIRYVILDRDLQVVAGPTFLLTPHGNSGRHPSVARTEAGAVILWPEQFGERLYQAVVAPDGAIVEAPQLLDEADQFVLSVGAAATRWRSPLTERIYLPLLER